MRVRRNLEQVFVPDAREKAVGIADRGKAVAEEGRVPGIRSELPSDLFRRQSEARDDPVIPGQVELVDFPVEPRDIGPDPESDNRLAGLGHAQDAAQAAVSRKPFKTPVAGRINAKPALRAPFPAAGLLPVNLELPHAAGLVAEVIGLRRQPAGRRARAPGGQARHRGFPGPHEARLDPHVQRRQAEGIAAMLAGEFSGFFKKNAVLPQILIKIAHGIERAGTATGRGARQRALTALSSETTAGSTFRLPPPSGSRP